VVESAWMVHLGCLGARRVYRRSSLSKGRLGRLSFWSRCCGSGGVVAVEVCVVCARAVPIGTGQCEWHAMSLFVPWYNVFGGREH
jgi:hypothetical protein